MVDHKGCLCTSRQNVTLPFGFSDPGVNGMGCSVLTFLTRVLLELRDSCFVQRGGAMHVKDSVNPNGFIN